MTSPMKASVVVEVFDRATAELRRIGRAIQGLGKIAAEPIKPMIEVSESFKGLGAGVLSGEMLKGPLEAYKEFDGQLTIMRESFATKGGGVQDGFDQLVNKCIELSQKLPVTAAAAKDMASELGSLGNSAKQIASGQLEAVMGLKLIMDPRNLQTNHDFATQFTETMHGGGIMDPGQMRDAANIMQQVSKSSGMKTEDMDMAYKYMGPVMEAMGYTGLDNFKETLVHLAAMHIGGMSGSHAGVEIKDMLTQLAVLDNKMDRKSMQPLNDLLKDKGIQIKAFNEDGTAKSLRDVVGEISKLNVLTPQQKITSVTKMLNEQGGSGALLLDIMDKRGITDNIRQKILQQPELEDRTKTLMGSWENKLNALQATWTNVQAAMGLSVGDDLKHWTDALKEWLAGLDTWIRDHQNLARQLMIGAGLFGAFAAGVGGIGMVLAAVTSPIVLVSAALAGLGMAALFVWSHWEQVSKWLARLWAGLGKNAQWEVPLLAVAATLMVMVAPITAVIAAVVALGVAAVWVFTHWEQVSKWLARQLQALLKSPWKLAIAGLLALGVAVGVVAMSMGVLGAVMAALFSPITLVVVAVGLLAASAVWIYNNWSKLPDLFRRLWDQIIGGATAVGRWLGRVLGGAVKGIEQIWAALPGFFVSLWSRVLGAFGMATGFISRLAGGALKQAAQDLTTAWAGVASFFEAMWNRVVSGFRWAWDQIKPIIDAIASVHLPEMHMPSLSSLNPFGGPEPAASDAPNVKGLASEGFGRVSPPGATPGKADVRGQIDIRVKSDGAAQITAATSNQPDLSFGADPGHAFAGAY